MSIPNTPFGPFQFTGALLDARYSAGSPTSTRRLNQPHMVGISASTVDQGKMRLGAEINGLDLAVIRCNKPISDDTRYAWNQWAKSYRSFWAKDTGFFSAGEENAQLETYRQEFNAWNEKLTRLCGADVPYAVKPADAPTPPPPPSENGDPNDPGSVGKSGKMSNLDMLKLLGLGVAAATILLLYFAHIPKSVRAKEYAARLAAGG